MESQHKSQLANGHAGGVGREQISELTYRAVQHDMPCQGDRQGDGVSSVFDRERNGVLHGENIEHDATTNFEEALPSAKYATEDVAIIGFSLRFPQDAVSPDGFWNMLYEGRSAMTEIPKDRFNVDAFYHPDSNRISSINFRGGHFVRNIAAFDAPFFSITPAEAASMDPQQRGLLEITYRALENSGITTQKASRSKTSVHVGCFTREYDHLSYRDPELQPKYQASGSGFALLANRLSWYYDLTGPSMVIDTACSSSLNAIHLGCESLRRGESNMGIVAGCNLIINPDTSTPLTNLTFLSPDSRCFSFDHRANGYARGEGIGVAIIKRLSDAVRDGDTIRAVVRASGANQDGRTPGITQPSQAAQVELIGDTYKSGGLDLSLTRYFEAHGTGTAIGDPIEAGAIATVFGPKRSPSDPLFIGAVKSNIGHLEGASGIAGILKTILVLERGVIPPNIGFERVNPRIPVEDWSLKFPLEPTPWPTKGLRRASVNSFGYGGANCHVVLDDACHYLKLRSLSGRHNTVESPPALLKRLSMEKDTSTSMYESRADRASDAKAREDDLKSTDLISSAPTGSALNDTLKSVSANSVKSNGYETALLSSNSAGYTPRTQLLAWSASDEAGVGRLAESYCVHPFDPKRRTDTASMDALAYTLASKRDHFPWKSFSIAESIGDMQKRLLGGMISKPVRSVETARLGFIFSGQGAAWNGMGRELLAYPVFGESLQASEEYLRTLGLGIPVLSQLESQTGYTNLHRALVSQSLSTMTQIALIDLLRSWEIIPRTVVGQSSGEIAAAYCIGAISKNSALRIAYYRGLLAGKFSSKGQHQGAMLAVALPEAEVEPYLSRFGSDAKHRDIFLGCINGPKNVTLTGSMQSVDAFEAIMKSENIFARKLNVDVAYHSKFLDSIVSEYEAHLQDIIHDADRIQDFEPPSMISTVSAQVVSQKQLRRAEYWSSNMVSPVRFSEALLQMCVRPSEQGRSQTWSDSHQSVGKVNALVEVGPHSVLRSSVRDALEVIGESKRISYHSILVRGLSATKSAIEMAGELYCSGCQLNLIEVNMPGAKSSDLNMLVDLPGYPFDHSRKYWQESRLSSNFRFRRHPRHELLGTPVPDWNQLEAKWRNFIRISESPWVTDHLINNSQLFPAAGMLVMALEAARQQADETRTLTGYRIKETTFHKAMVVPSHEEGLETNFFLRPQGDGKGQQVSWSNFRLCSCLNGEWVDNCRGIVGLEYKETEAEVDNGREAREELKLRSRFFRSLGERCKMPVKPGQLYDVLRSSGYGFGPTFQVLRGVACNDDNEATAILDQLDWQSKLPEQHIQDHVIHPTCLDGVLQITSIILTKGGRRQIPTTYPTRIENMWLSADVHSTSSKCTKFRASGTTVFKGFREVDTSIMAMDYAGEKPRIVIDGFQARALADLNSGCSTNSEPRRLCFNIDWKPDLDLMDSDQITRFCRTATIAGSRDEAITERSRDLELTCLLFMRRSLLEVSQEDLALSTPHMQKYYRWMKRELDRHNADNPGKGTLLWNEVLDDQGLGETLFNRMEDLDPVGKLIVAVGRQQTGILRDQVNVMELLFDSDLATEVYRYLAENDCNYKRLAVYLDALAHKHPGLRILEIGAGTGGTTAPALDALSQSGRAKNTPARCSKYTFTDISPSFFEKAKARFADHFDRMDFRVLNIEADPLEQGFEAESHDVVIAANVLHATADINATLQNTRKLLKPGGKLILFECCNPDLLRVPFAFGMLSGWWLSLEKHRQWSPLMTEDLWDEKLSENGFSGADVILRDHDYYLNHSVSMIISTVVEKKESAVTPPKVIIVASKDSSAQLQVADLLLAHVTSSVAATECAVIDPQGILSTSFEQTFCILLVEIEHPYLLDLTADKLAGIQRIVASASGILWVTQAGTATIKPEFALVEGLSRTSRSENTNLRFVTLAIEDAQDLSRTIETILKAFSATISKDHRHIESEYLERNSLLHINRVIEDYDMNEEIFLATGAPKPQLQPFNHQPDRPLKLTVGVPGLLDTLQFVDDILPKQGLNPDEVEVEVRACGVNFIDVMIALGQVAGDYLGTECSGVVKRVGRNVTNVRPGSRVCCLAYGGYRSYVRNAAELVAEIPGDLTFATAAGLLTVYCTAFHALFNVARVAEGESILIHCAAGGVGQAAIQLAKILGAEIYVTVGTEHKKTLVMDLYSIPEDHIFSSRNNTFSKGIRRMTRNRGVDVILNSIAGIGLRDSWDCIAKFGRFVEIGKSDIYAHGSLPMWPFSKCTTFASVNLTMMAQEKRSLLSSVLTSVMGLIKYKKITIPYPQHNYPGSEILEAFRYLQSGNNTGKAIIELRGHDLVPIVPDLSPHYTFSSNATFVVAGSSGGLGRSIARWLVRRGARNLILFSRSGMTSKAAADLIIELQDQGVNVVALMCDVSNTKALSVALEHCSSMPPIKGCIQASLVLKDCIIENLSLNDFKAVLSPKVRGSWNLHTQLPRGMDFFILLSSAAGITGNRGQSNYSCGNTYQDALARHRTSNGQKATAIDLSIVGSVGFIADRLGTEAAIQTSPEFMTIQEKELHAVLDHYCDPSLTVPSPEKSQLVMGIQSPAELTSNGLDEPIWARRSLFRHLAYTDLTKFSKGDVAAGRDGVDLMALLRGAKSVKGKEEIICQALVRRISKLLSVPEGDVDVKKPMHRYGIDSLMVVEIRHWIRQEMKAEVTVIDILEGQSVGAVGALVASRSQIP